MKRRIITIALSVALLFTMMPWSGITDSNACADVVYAKAYKETQAKIKEAVSAASSTGFGGEWVVIGAKRSGLDIPTSEFTGYYNKIAEYAAANADANNRLHRYKSTDNSKLVISLTSIRENVTNVGGVNLLKGLSDIDYVRIQGLNAVIWALIAFDSHNYDIPKVQTGGNQTTRDKLIQLILDAQLSDGGWSLPAWRDGNWVLDGEKADSDMTGMAIQALAPYYGKKSKVKTAVDKALTKVSKMQLSDGNYGTIATGTATSESCAQIIVGLTALGINPDTDSRFVKNGKSVVDALLGYAVTGGGFKHVSDGEINGLATEQAYYALTAYYRMLEGKNSLYDMTDIDLKSCVHKVVKDSAVPATCTKSGKTQGTHCSICKIVLTPQIAVAPKGHSLRTTVNKATTKASGSKITTCSRCDYNKSVQIAAIKTISLSKKSYTYNNKTKKPTVTVKDTKGKILVKNTDYTVKYEKNKYVGTATAKVVFKGKYSGSRTLKFKIKPEGTTIRSLKSGEKKFTVKWYKKTAQVSGYKIRYSTSSKMTDAKTVKISDSDRISKTVKSVKSGRKYYVQVRTYKIVNGTRYQSGWSKKSSVTIK